MKKGFTLIELIIVMVIVTILVTIAVPKYKGAMERGRGLELIANGQAVSDAVNAYYVVKGNTYNPNNLEDTDNIEHALCDYAVGEPVCLLNTSPVGVAGITKSDNYQLSIDATTATAPRVDVQRINLGSKNYTLHFVNENGETTERYCTGYEKYCNILGADQQVTRNGSTAWLF